MVAGVAAMEAHRHVHVLWLMHQAGCPRHVVVLEGGLVIVQQRQRMMRLDQKVIIQASMLVVVNHSRPV